jgi:hypothetical protein
MSFFSRQSLVAFSIHLAISSVIALLCLSLVFGLWYPKPLAQALEVSHIFVLMLCIDLILGPLITLVVYKPGKSTLKFDLTTVACIQLLALFYGLYTVGSARPAYLVFTKDRFDLVQAYEVSKIAGTPSSPSLAPQNPWSAPLMGYQLKSAFIPRDNEPVLSLLMASAISGGPDVPHVLDFHQNYAQAFSKIAVAGLNVSQLKSQNILIQASIDALQRQYPRNSVVAPLKIKYKIYTVVMDPVDWTILGIEPIDPFK